MLFSPMTSVNLDARSFCITIGPGLAKISCKNTKEMNVFTISTSSFLLYYNNNIIIDFIVCTQATQLINLSPEMKEKTI